jgi:hypothetical protein
LPTERFALKASTYIWFAILWCHLHTCTVWLICFSTIIFAITRGWQQVRSGRSGNSLTNQIKKKIRFTDERCRLLYDKCCCYNQQQGAKQSTYLTLFIRTKLLDSLVSFIPIFLHIRILTIPYNVLFWLNVPFNFRVFVYLNNQMPYCNRRKHRTIFVLRYSRGNRSHHWVTSLQSERFICLFWIQIVGLLFEGKLTTSDSFFCELPENSEYIIFERYSSAGAWGTRISHISFRILIIECLQYWGKYSLFIYLANNCAHISRTTSLRAINDHRISPCRHPWLLVSSPYFIYLLIYVP